MAILILTLMILFMFLGLPVGFAMGLSGIIGLFILGGWDSVLTVMATVPFRTAAHYTLTTVPMFILMAQYISASNIVQDVFIAARRWLEGLPGGLAIATVFASAGMGAMCGSSTASAAAMSSISAPEMLKYGYSNRVTSGVIAVSGTLAIMIPPSLAFIIYGVVTETSIGKLLIAGIIPGVLTSLMYTVGIIMWAKFSPGIMPEVTHIYSWKDRWNSLKPLWAFIILISLVIGSMYAGLATPTEAAAFGAFGALLVPSIMGRLGMKAIIDSTFKAIRISTMLFTIVIGAMVLGYFFAINQTPQNIIKLLTSYNLTGPTVMMLVIILYLILGCIMDQIAILLLTLPLIFPLITSLGYDAIWFGVIVTKVAEIGLVTPPVGMNAYVVSAATKIPLEEVFKGTGVMLLIDSISLFILLLFPIISTWLPSLM